jgi:hypothetical protein
MRATKLVLAVVVTLVAIAATVVLLDLERIGAAFVTGREAISFLILTLVLVSVLALYLVTRDAERYVATLMGTTIWIPWVAGLVASAIFLADSSDDQFWRTNALVLGGGLAVTFWLIYAIVDRDYPTANRQSPGWHDLLKERLEQLKLEATQASQEPMVDSDVICKTQVSVLAIADRTLSHLARPGLQWVSRTGFNAAWTACHHGEEELVAIAPRPWLEAMAIGDILRLNGSDMKLRLEHQSNLRASLTELDVDIKPYLTRLIPEASTLSESESSRTNTAQERSYPTIPDPEAPAETGAPADAARPSTTRNPSAFVRWLLPGVGLAKPTRKLASAARPVGQTKGPDAREAQNPDQRARLVIGSTHRALSAYRGSRWAELGRARWQLTLTTTVAGIFAFLVLALSVVGGINPPQLLAGWAYFLIGAVAGLFLRLYLASREIQVSDDYGLEAARLYQTPLLSGIAAVIGVVLMASIAGSSLGIVLTPEPSATTPTPATSASPSLTESETAEPSVSAAPDPGASSVPQETVPASAEDQATTETLGRAFDLGSYPLGVVIAIAFGLTPNLVLRRLGVSVTNAKRDLISTRPAE